MLKVVTVSKNFKKPLFEQASMQVERGKGAVLQGPNGVGKSTLLRMVAGLMTPDQGEILLDGKPVQTQRARMGFCPSTSAGFYRRLSVRQNLHYFGSLYGLKRAQVDRYIADCTLFAIDYWDEPTEKLSDGMLQKIKLLRTFMHEPELALLDEPLNYLDKGSKQAFIDWLRAWRVSGPGRAFLLTQHSSELAGETAWVIRERRLEQADA